MGFKNVCILENSQSSVVIAHEQGIECQTDL